MKILKTFLKVSLFIVLLAVCFVGVSIYLVTDSTPIDSKYENSTHTISYEVNELISKALKDTESTSKLDFTFTEEELSYLLSAITKTFNSYLPKQLNVRGTTVDFSEQGDVKLCLFANYLFFQTTFRATLEIDSNESFLILKLNNASIGKIEADGNYITKIVSRFITNEEINNTLKQNGYDITLDLANLTISISKQNLQTILEEKFSQDKNKDLYQSLIDIIFNNELIKLEQTNSTFGVGIDVSNLSNPHLIENVEPFFYDYPSINSKCEKLLNENIINEEQTTYIFNYLIYGYDYYKDNDNYKFIEELDLNSIDISNPKKYEGVLPNNVLNTMSSILLNQLPDITNILDPALNINISAQDLTNILYQTNIAGLAYTFPRTESDGTKKISYIVLESIYSKINEEQITLILVLNLNGKKTNIECNLKTVSSEGLILSTEVQTMKFGNISLSKEQDKFILSFLNSILSEEKWFETNVEKLTVNLNFTKVFTTSPILNAIIEKSTNTSVDLKENMITIGILLG